MHLPRGSPGHGFDGWLVTSMTPPETAFANQTRFTDWGMAKKLMGFNRTPGLSLIVSTFGIPVASRVHTTKPVGTQAIISVMRLQDFSGRKRVFCLQKTENHTIQFLQYLSAASPATRLYPIPFHLGRGPSLRSILALNPTTPVSVLCAVGDFLFSACAVPLLLKLPLSGSLAPLGSWV